MISTNLNSVVQQFTYAKNIDVQICIGIYNNIDISIPLQVRYEYDIDNLYLSLVIL